MTNKMFVPSEPQKQMMREIIKDMPVYNPSLFDRRINHENLDGARDRKASSEHGKPY